jgi:hypothetical protein
MEDAPVFDGARTAADRAAAARAGAIELDGDKPAWFANDWSWNLGPGNDWSMTGNDWSW